MSRSANFTNRLIFARYSYSNRSLLKCLLTTFKCVVKVMHYMKTALLYNGINIFEN